jgi:hypothetical protein
MANTYTLIASSTVGAGGASNIEFTSISASYTNLLVKVSVRGDSGGTDIKIQFNGSTSSVYSFMRVYGTGNAVATSGTTTTNLINNMVAQSSYTANTFGNGEFYIAAYASNAYKVISADGTTENNNTGSFIMMTANQWSSSSAVHTIRLYDDDGGSFVQYSSFYLYGIKNS